MGTDLQATLAQALAERAGLIERAKELEAKIAILDCRTNDGWMSDDVECQIDADPRCLFHSCEQLEAELERLRAGIRELLAIWPPRSEGDAANMERGLNRLLEKPDAK